LPEDLTERARATFRAVLKYAYQLLTLEHSTGLPSDLQVKECDEDPLGFLDTPDTYCTVLFNDETHTFEQVRKTRLCQPSLSGYEDQCMFWVVMLYSLVYHYQNFGGTYFLLSLVRNSCTLKMDATYISEILVMI
jgi:hypothetical protein